MRADFRIEKDRFHVKTPYLPVVIEAFRKIDGRSFHPGDKSWSFPLARDQILAVCDTLGTLPAMLPVELKKVVNEGQDGCDLRLYTPVDTNLLDGMTFASKPYDHQRVNLARLIEKDRWILADEQGTGKTWAVVNRLRHAIGAHPEIPVYALILCPKSVVNTWKEELFIHGNLYCEIIEGNPKQKARIIGRPLRDCPTGWPHRDQRYRILVTNYETVLSMFGKLSALIPEFIILDEVHRLKNFTGKTSRLVRKMTEACPHVWGLSGTPAPNGLQDWLGVLSAVSNELLPTQTKTAFEARYCVKQQLGPGGPWKIQGYRNVTELHGFVSQICSRVTKAECLDLPEKVYCTRAVRLEGEQRRIYLELKKDAVARLKATGESLTVANVLTESLRLLQVVGGFVPDDDGAVHEIADKVKVGALADVLDDLGNRQAVIWCAFLAEVEYLAAWLAERYGAGISVLTGDVSGEQRAKAIEDFRSGETRFFVGTAAAGGTGINGLQVADTEIYYSRNWNLATYLQSQDRLHRIGQKNRVTVVNLIALGTVDSKVDEALMKKANLQELLLHSPEEVF